MIHQQEFTHTVECDPSPVHICTTLSRACGLNRGFITKKCCIVVEMMDADLKFYWKILLILRLSVE